MALQMSFTSEEMGATFPSAYWKVDILRVRKEEILIVVGVYSDATARQNGKRPVENRAYTKSYDEITGANNSIQEAYNYLKTLSEFSTAIDI